MLELITPDWPAPPHVRAWCTTRQGGVSAAPYQSLNLGEHVGDAPHAVAHNRQRVAQAVQPLRPVYLNQVHGCEVVAAHAVANQASPSAGARTDANPSGHPSADAAWTDQRHVACVIGVADCLPILLCDRSGTVVGAAHAGWRGLAGVRGRGVLEALIEALVFGSKHATAPLNNAQEATDLIAWLGPCIGPDAFEVGADVVAAFVSDDAQAQAAFLPRGPRARAQMPHPSAEVPPPSADLTHPSAEPQPAKWLANLPWLARHRLRRAGVSAVFGNDGSAPWCTVGNASRFFSHRRDGVSGRMQAGIGLL